jgi:hypothetical protein
MQSDRNIVVTIERSGGFSLAAQSKTDRKAATIPKIKSLLKFWEAQLLFSRSCSFEQFFQAFSAIVNRRSLIGDR